ncbi:hypothetical protein ACFLTZ_06900, partial [Chloroflexota bacterium]
PGTITVVVDPKKPGITITSPAGGILTNKSSLVVSGTVTNATEANLIFNGVSQPLTLDGGGAFSTNVTLVEGVNVMVASAYATGHPADPDYLGTSGARTVTYDKTAPVVIIESPTSGSVVNNSLSQVSGTIDDPGVTTATLYHAGKIQTIPVVGGTFSQQVTLTSGSNTINVRATDKAGNQADGSPVTVNLDTAIPGVTITTPANRLLTNKAGQTVAGTVDDPSITWAYLDLNGSSSNISVAPDGSFNKMVTLSKAAPEVNEIEVRASDAGGNTGTSGKISVTLDSTAPVLTIGLSDPVDSIIITVTSSEALKTVPTVTVDSTAVTMAPVGVNVWSGTYGSKAAPIASGEYTVTAIGTDKAGNEATKTATFSKETIDVSGVEPTTVTTPTTQLEVETDGAVSDASISVTHTTQNPSGNVENPQDVEKPAGVFVEIVVSPELRDNLKQITIRVDYDPDELPEGTDESTLKLYLWDVASGTWKVVPGSTVNTTEHYIEATVTHLSKYGGFGSAVTEVTPREDGGLGGVAVPEGTTSLEGFIDTTGTFVRPMMTTSTDKKVVLAIDKDTRGLTKTGTVLKKITMVKMVELPAPPEDSKVVGLTYDLGPDGATFDPPITMEFKYNPSLIPEGVDEGKLVIAIWNEIPGKWEVLEDCVVDTAANTITAKVSHFTAFTIVAYTRPAAFSTSDLSVSPKEVGIGGRVTISVMIANTGDLTGSYQATLKVDKAVVETKEVTLAGGTSQKVTFSTTRDAAGTYDVAIDGLSGTFVVKAEALPPAPATFSTSDLSISPREVDIGGKVAISVMVANTGDLAGSYKVVLKVNGVVAETKEVTLSGGAEQKVTFSTTGDVGGSYAVDVNGLSGIYRVKAPPPPPPPPPEPVKWWLIAGIIAGVIIIGIIIWQFIIRRRI